MAGRTTSRKDHNKRKNDSSTDNDVQNNNHDQQHFLQIDIDELAKAKVREVELIIESSAKDYSLDALNSSLSVLKQIITAADLHRTSDSNEQSGDVQSRSHELGESIYADFTDDNEQFNAHVDLSEQFATNSVKWTIRVQAFRLVHQLVWIYIHAPSNANKSKSALFEHLSDLVRLSFVAATSPYDELKMQGLEMFLYLIGEFAQVEEKEFFGHSILEQYKTQVLSAIKPAFNSDAPPYITAMASQICSLWICQGLEKNPNDVRRAHQLMLASVDKLESQSINQNSKLYTESELERERVDILSSWAQLIVASRELDLLGQGRIFNLSEAESANLHSLVKPQIENLVDKWWEALKDYALLIMPAPRLIGTSSHDNGHVYTREVALRLFEPAWPKLILASTIWLCNSDHTSCQINCDTTDLSPKSHRRATIQKYTKFLCGFIMKEFCRQQVVSDKLTKIPESTLYAVKTLNLLLIHKPTRLVISEDIEIAQEIYTILYNVTICYCRASNRYMLKTTLDLLFRMVLDHSKPDVRYLHFATVKLISQIMTSMKDTEIAIRHRHESLDIDEARMHVSIRLLNLLTLIKFSPNEIFNETQLQEAIILVFQELLRFDVEPNFIIATIEHLNDLYTLIPVSSKRHFLSSMIKELCSRASSIFRCLYDGSPNESDKISALLWEAFIRSSRIAILSATESDCPELVDAYVSTLVINLDDKLDEYDRLKRKRDLLDASLEQIKYISKSLPIDLNSALSDETRIKFKEANKIQVAIKLKLDAKAKQDKISQSKKASSGQTINSSRHSAAKITLKADFSNFYTKS